MAGTGTVYEPVQKEQRFTRNVNNTSEVHAANVCGYKMNRCVFHADIYGWLPRTSAGNQMPCARQQRRAFNEAGGSASSARAIECFARVRIHQITRTVYNANHNNNKMNHVEVRAHVNNKRRGRMLLGAAEE